MKDLKRIIYFLDFPSGIGGASKVLLTQAFIMKQKGFQVMVVIPVDKEGKYAKEYDELCRYFDIETATQHYMVSVCMENLDIIEILEEYEAIVKLLQMYRPDFIHSTQLNIAVELAARKLEIPHLMNIYQVDRDSFRFEWMNLYPQYHSADSILFSERWKSGLGIASRCIRVAYQTKKREYNSLECVKETSMRILTIGILCERKNQIEIIKFIHKCKENGLSVKLTILGRCNNAYGEKCKKFVDENGLSNDVAFAGVVLNVEDYLEKADLFIMASTVESYPGVIVESMANKIPVVSTAIAGIPELVQDGQNGFLISGHMAEDIYEGYLRYIDYRERGMISQVVENAYATYLEHHTYKAIGKQLESYYKWIQEDYYTKGFSGLGAEEIKKRFDNFICEKKIERTDSRSRKQLWFLYHMFSEIERKDNKKFAVWGAGCMGAEAIKWIQMLGTEVEFIGFIDTKKAGEYLGYPIAEDRESVVAECGTILVAMADAKGRLEIMDYLEQHGKIRNKDYFLMCNFSELIRL